MKCEGESCKLFLFDFERTCSRHSPRSPAGTSNPVFSPDGRRMAYAGFAIGAPTLFVEKTRTAAGSGAAHRRPDGRESVAEFPASCLRRKRIAYIAVTIIASGTERGLGRDIWLVSADGSGVAGRGWRVRTPSRRRFLARRTLDGLRLGRSAGRRSTCGRFRGRGAAFRFRATAAPSRSGARGAEFLYRRGDEFVAAEVHTDRRLPLPAPGFFSRRPTRGGDVRTTPSSTPLRGMGTRSTSPGPFPPRRRSTSSRSPRTGPPLRAASSDRSQRSFIATKFRRGSPT